MKARCYVGLTLAVALSIASRATVQASEPTYDGRPLREWIDRLKCHDAGDRRWAARLHRRLRSVRQDGGAGAGRGAAGSGGSRSPVCCRFAGTDWPRCAAGTSLAHPSSGRDGPRHALSDRPGHLANQRTGQGRGPRAASPAPRRGRASTRRRPCAGNGRPGAKPALPLLAEMLKDSDPHARINAALAVWKIDRQTEGSVSVLAACAPARGSLGASIRGAEPVPHGAGRPSGPAGARTQRRTTGRKGCARRSPLCWSASTRRGSPGESEPAHVTRTACSPTRCSGCA